MNIVWIKLVIYNIGTYLNSRFKLSVRQKNFSYFSQWRIDYIGTTFKNDSWFLKNYHQFLEITNNLSSDMSKACYNWLDEDARIDRRTWVSQDRNTTNRISKDTLHYAMHDKFHAANLRKFAFEIPTSSKFKRSTRYETHDADDASRGATISVARVT